MGRYSARLVTPPQDEEIHPYRRVWASIALESGILFAICAGVFAAFNLIGVSVPTIVEQGLQIVLVLLPLILWGLFSLWREQRVPLPRERLFAVMIMTALAANALGQPIVDLVFQPERWLPLAPVPTRIVAYAITVGTLQEFIKYMVVRYAAWREFFRTRLDSVAYTFASAVGYATVLNVQFVLASPSASPDALALHVFETMALGAAASIVVAYGLAELRFATPSPLFLPLTLIIASFLYGGLIPIRTNFVNASFSLAGGFPKPLIGLLLSFGVLIVISFVFSFLFERSERAAQEAEAAEGRA